MTIYFHSKKHFEEMKVLFLSNSIGGLKSFRMELIQKLRDNGHNVGICSPLEINPMMFEEIGCNIFPVQMSRHGKNPLKEFRLISIYKKTIEEFNPDICLAYTIKPNVYGSLACKRLKVPIISSVTGLGKVAEINGILQKVTLELLKFGLNNSDHVFFQNEESLNFIISKGVSLKSKSLVAGSGVNLEKFYFSEYPHVDNGINFLYTGRILEEKGVGLYLEAAKILTKEYPNVKFHIVGIKDDIKYSDMVDDYHSKGIITFHGYHQDPRDFIKLSHCQVHPTYYPEGMSNVLLESSAMGRPAITTDRSGCREIIDDGETGFIIGQRSIEELLTALRKFIKLPWETKKIMGIKARAKVEKEFDRNIVIQDYICKIEELTHLKV